MRNNEGYIDVCGMLGIPLKPYCDTPELFEELHILLLNKRNAKIIKYYNGTNLVFSFVYNGEIYYFNFDSRVDPYTNLVYEEVCHDLDVDAVSYDLASLGNVKGNISKNYKKDDAKYISGYNILLESEVHKSKGDDNVLAPGIIPDALDKIENVIFKYNTLESIWAALEIRYENHPKMEEIVKKLMDKLISIFIVDVLLGNTDRTYENWEVVEYVDGEVDLAPVFDGARSLMAHTFYTRLGTTVETRTKPMPDYRLDNNLLKFLSISPSEDTEKFLNSTWVLSHENILKIIARIEKKTNTPMPMPAKLELIQKFQIHEEAIHTIINDYYRKIKR